MKKTKVTSKKWGYVARLWKYAFSHQKITKYLCSGRKSGLAVLNISPAEYTCTQPNDNSDAVGRSYLVTRGLGENNGVESESPVELI